MEINIKPCKISTSFKTEKIYPKLEELTVKPSTEAQIKEGAFGKVVVEAIKTDNLVVTPSEEKQNFNGLFENVTVEASSGGIDTSDATATANDIREGKTAYVNGEKIVGTLKLPYRVLEYIESDGNQYINTGVKATVTVGAELTVSCDNTSESAFFGAWNEYNGFIFGQANWWDIPEYAIAGHSVWINAGIACDTNWHIYTYDPVNAVATIDGEAVDVDIQNNNGYDKYISMFRGSGYDQHTSGVRISSCKMYNAGILIRNYIPVIREDDGVVCMYDLVEQKFVLNAGTGEFIAGPEV